jgi:HK97 family phage portal protein|tara:strand:- start:11978 stop:13438 length:1461 start_codon:yes stop_codon:yes gene_type:complete
MAWYSLPFKKADKQNLEVKNSITPPVELSFAEFLFRNGDTDLSFARMNELYRDVLPFSNAIDIRARSFSDTPTRLVDEDGKYIRKHPMLDIINKPNDIETRGKFLYSLASNYDITGNVFVIATGNPDNAPFELLVIPSYRISPIGTSKRFGWLNIPACFYVSNDGFEGDKFIAESNGDGVRYVNEYRNKELIPITSFNPTASSINFFGLSKAQPALSEMEQYLEGNMNNLSNLKRGARPSMVWQNTKPEMLTDEQWTRAQQMSQKYAGSQNAGGIPILDGLDAKPVSSSNNEMQFRDLQKDMFERINVIYDIPLPMVTSTANTFNNYETAQVSLWDNAVMPLANVLYAALTKALLPRYDAAGLSYSLDPIDVIPLRRRAIETAKLQHETNINTVNEIRNLIGYDDGDKAWDEIYAPLNQMPLGYGSQVMGDPDANNPSNQMNDQSRNDEESSKKFRMILSEMKTEGGKAKYTAEEIDVMAADSGYA